MPKMRRMPFWTSVTDTYGKQSVATSTKAHDSYIKAFRWASDKIAKTRMAASLGFITNSGWLEGNSADGFL